MPRTNVKLAAANYAFSAGGASGFSQLVLSYALRAGDDFAEQGGNFVVAITNAASTAPLIVELRTTWQDANGVSQTTPAIHAFISNAQTYGGSAFQAQTQTLLTSGQNGLIPFGFVAGNAVQVWVIAGSSVADSAGVSGAVALWSI